jgi:hypothetical protein
MCKVCVLTFYTSDFVPKQMTQERSIFSGCGVARTPSVMPLCVMNSKPPVTYPTHKLMHYVTSYLTPLFQLYNSRQMLNI